MIAYNLPSLTLCVVKAIPDFTTAIEIPLPTGFYAPRTIWKLQISGQSSDNFKSGMKLARRVSLGDLVISELFGVGRGKFQMAFSDTITFHFYGDNLFDVRAVGINSQSPVSEHVGDGPKVPRSAIGEAAISHADSPAPDRSKPIRISFLVEPIGDADTVLLEQATLIQLT